MPSRRKDNKTFVKLANKRVNATINSLSMVKRMAESCQHTPTQVAKIFKAIRHYVDDAEKAFIEERKPQDKFNLEEKLNA